MVVLLSNLISPTSSSLSFSPSEDMLIVVDAEHARPDDTLSPNKTQFHQKLIFFDYVVPLLLSLVDQRRKPGDTDAPLNQE